jgi:hypothetical protein
MRRTLLPLRVCLPEHTQIQVHFLRFLYVYGWLAVINNGRSVTLGEDLWTHAIPLMSLNTHGIPSDCLDEQTGRPFHSATFVSFRADYAWLSSCDILQPDAPLWFSARLIGRVAESNDMNLTPVECVQITLRSLHRAVWLNRCRFWLAFWSGWLRISACTAPVLSEVLLQLRSVGAALVSLLVHRISRGIIFSLVSSTKNIPQWGPSNEHGSFFWHFCSKNGDSLNWSR